MHRIGNRSGHYWSRNHYDMLRVRIRCPVHSDRQPGTAPCRYLHSPGMSHCRSRTDHWAQHTRRRQMAPRHTAQNTRCCTFAHRHHTQGQQSWDICTAAVARSVHARSAHQQHRPDRFDTVLVRARRRPGTRGRQHPVHTHPRGHRHRYAPLDRPYLIDHHMRVAHIHR